MSQEDRLRKAQERLNYTREHGVKTSQERLNWANDKSKKWYSGPASSGSSTGGGTANYDPVQSAIDQIVSGNVQSIKADTDKLSRDLAEIGKWDKKDRDLMKYASMDYDGSGASYALTDLGENAARKELDAKYGKGRMAELVESYRRGKNIADTVKAEERAEKAVEEDGKLISTLKAIPTNVIGGAAGSLAYMGDIAEDKLKDAKAWITGKDREENYYQSLDSYAGGPETAWAGKVYQKSGEELLGDGKTSGKIKSTLYSAAVNVGESALRMALGAATGLGEGMSLGLAGTSAFTGAVSDASKRGASPDQAAIYGSLMAASEIATEKIPFDKATDIFKSAGKGGLKKFVRKALELGGSDLLGEEANLVAELLADALVMRDESNYKRDLAQTEGDMIANGMSAEEAKKEAKRKVNRSIGKQAIDTAVQSLLSSLFMGGGANVLGKAFNKVTGNTTQETTTEEVQPLPDATEAEEQVVEQPTEEAVTEATEAPQETQPTALELAVEEVANGGNVTNKVAETLLADPDAIQQMQDDGLELPPNRAGQRKAVKDYVSQKAQEAVSATTQESLQVAPTAEESTAVTPSEEAQTIQQEMDYIASQMDGLMEAQRNGEITAQEMVEQRRVMESQLDELQERLDTTLHGETAEDRNYVAEEYEDAPIDPIEDVAQEINRNNGIATEPTEAPTMPQNETISETTNVTEEAEQPTREVPGSTTEESESTKGYSREKDYVPLLKKGEHEPRKGDVRPVEVPLKDADGKRVSDVVSNVYGSHMTPDSFVERIERLTAEGKTSDYVAHNVDTLSQSAERIAKKGIPEAAADVIAIGQSGRVSLEDVADAQNLYSYLVNEPDEMSQSLAENVFVALTQMGRAAGRSEQLMSVFRKSNMEDMFNHMTPEQQTRVVVKQVRKDVEHLVDTHVAKPRDYTIDQNLVDQYTDKAEAYKKAKGAEEKQKALDEMDSAKQAIYMNVSGKLKATLKTKWDSWRYMSMLGNGVTNARNFFGSAGFIPFVDAKNVMKATLERVFVEQDKRTTSILPSVRNTDMVKWAYGDSKTAEVQEFLGQTNQMKDNKSGFLRDNMAVYNTKFLENFRKISEEVPSATDMLFKRDRYARTLAGFMQARGYTMEDVNSGAIPADVMAEARAYSALEAMKATFNDMNTFSDFVANIGRGPTHNAFETALQTAAEGIMPFRRTPANIVVRAWEYSPMTLIKGIDDMTTSILSGESTPSQAIDKIASGMVGTAAWGLGALLASGLGNIRLTGSDVSDEEKQNGVQPYSVVYTDDEGNITSYRIDWLAPTNLPLFVGANMYQTLTQDGDGNDDFSVLSNFAYDALNSFEPLLELSCLSSLSNVIDSVSSADSKEGKVFTLASNIAMGYIKQGIPTLLRQADRTINRYQQSTYTTSKDPLTKVVQREIANTPLLYNLKTGKHLYKDDYVDTEGNVIDQGNVLERAFNNFINPGRVKSGAISKVDNEVERLNGVQSYDVSRDALKRSLSFDDKNGNPVDRLMTSEEYKKAQTAYGKTSETILSKVIKTQAYADLTDEQKAQVFDTVYTYAKSKALGKAIEGHPGIKTAWMKNLTEGLEGQGIVNNVIENSISNAFETATGSWKQGKNDTDQLLKMYDQIGHMNYNTIKGLPDNGQVGYVVETIKAGIPAKTSIDLYKQYYTIGQKPIKSGEKATQWSGTVDKAMKQGRITGEQASMLKDNGKYMSSHPAESPTYDRMVEGGMDYDDAVAIDKAFRDAEYSETRTAITDGDKVSAIVNSPDLTQEEMDRAVRITLEHMQKKNMDKALEYALDHGATYQQFGDALKGYYWDVKGDMTTYEERENKIQNIMKFADCTEAQATEWYNTFKRKYR